MFHLFGVDLPVAVCFSLAIVIVSVVIGAAAWAMLRLDSARAWNPFPATGDYVPAATRQTADAQFPIIIIPGRAAAGDATQPPAGAALILRPL